MGEQRHVESHPQAPALQCVVYVSSAADLWSDSALAGLIAHARISNQSNGITGALLYRRRQFTQVLEGPQPEVDTLLAKIERDPRHHNLCVLLRRGVASRAFTDWDLAGPGDRGEDEMDEIAAAIRALPASSTLSQFGMADLLQFPPPQDAPELRHPAQQDRARNTIERLYRSARRLLLQGGGTALTVPRLAHDAGVSQPTFYRYFGDLNEFLRAGVRNIALRRARDWIEVIDGHHFVSDDSLADMLASLGTRNFLRVQNLPPQLAQAVLPHINSLANEIARTVAPAVLRAIARCDLAPGAVLDEDLMTALLSGMLGAAVALAGTDVDRLRGEEARRIAAGMLLGGLRGVLGGHLVK